MTGSRPHWLHDATQSSFAGIKYLAVAVKKTAPGQNHVGVLYLHDPATGEFRLLHLAFHYWLRCDAPQESYFWVAPKIPKRQLRTLAGLCRLVDDWRRGGGSIPYGLDQARFDPQAGTIQLPDGATGLTCATFVLALTRSYGIELLKMHEWPRDRSDDSRWLDDMCANLSQFGASDAHVAALRGKLGDFQRFRPEEVAAGAAHALPCGFVDAERDGTHLDQFLPG